MLTPATLPANPASIVALVSEVAGLNVATSEAPGQASLDQLAQLLHKPSSAPLSQVTVAAEAGCMAVKMPVTAKSMTAAMRAKNRRPKKREKGDFIPVYYTCLIYFL